MFLAFVTVPEAAVYKNGDLFLEEDEIGMTFDVVIATPTCDAIFLENLYELEFRRFVVLRTNVAHYLATLFCGEDVGH